MQFWKIALLGGGLTLMGWLGWRYSSQQTVTLVALNTHTGQIAWLHPFPDATDSFSRGPIAADGKVLIDFIQALNSEKQTGTSRPFYQLQALDAKSGQLLWTYHPPNNVYTAFDVWTSQSVMFQANQLYLQFGDEFRSLDPATGQQRWAIKRPWSVPDPLFTPMGVVILPEYVSMITGNKRERLLQFLDPKTGKVRRQSKFILDPRTTTRDLIAADDRSVFLQTTRSVQTGKESYQNSGPAITAYDIATGAVRFQTEIPASSRVSQFQAGPNGLQIKSDGYYDAKQGMYVGGLTLLAIDSTSGRVRWRKPYEQIPCVYDGGSWRVDADSIYLNCGEPRTNTPAASTVVAVSTQTGNVKWQTQTSFASNLFPPLQNSAVSAQQLLTFRQIKTGQSIQTQAIGLDRQTGKLLWSFPLSSARYVYNPRQVVATEGDRFFFLDLVPRWRIWLWQASSALSSSPSRP
jgi:polyvinyl alcohol dehydrogenase (cytochrome)